MSKVTLASILTEYFGCKNPVLKRSVPDDFSGLGRRYLTRSGERAYEKLIHVLEDVGGLVGMDAIDAIESLDEIADGHNYGLVDGE